jgi:hypothetical protein
MICIVGVRCGRRRVVHHWALSGAHPLRVVARMRAEVVDVCGALRGEGDSNPSVHVGDTDRGGRHHHCGLARAVASVIVHVASFVHPAVVGASAHVLFVHRGHPARHRAELSHAVAVGREGEGNPAVHVRHSDVDARLRHGATARGFGVRCRSGLGGCFRSCAAASGQRQRANDYRNAHHRPSLFDRDTAVPLSARKPRAVGWGAIARRIRARNTTTIVDARCARLGDPLVSSTDAAITRADGRAVKVLQ